MKIKKAIASLLATSMLMSNIAFAEELVDTERLSDNLKSVASFNLDKIKNITEDIVSPGSNDFEDVSDEVAPNEEFRDPGKELSGQDMVDLYDMGYSMVDISNAIKLSNECNKTPYEILQIKSGNASVLNRFFGRRKSAKTNITSNDKTWETVKQSLGVSENIEVEENSEIMYDGEPDDVNTIFKQSGINDILREEGLQETEISEAAEVGIIENADVEAEDSDEILPESETAKAIILAKDEISGNDMTLMSTSDDDNMVSWYNGYIYPMAKYNNEKTSGYTVEKGYDINPVSGNLMVSENDLNLKGINGLDLNLNRIYSSERANMLDADVDVSGNSTYRKPGYYRLDAAAEIKITYRESTSNGGTVKTVTTPTTLTLVPPQDDGNGFYIYSAVGQAYVDEQIEKNNISSLYNHSSDAAEAKQKALDGKYDKTITFSRGRISKIVISVTDDEDCITRSECMVAPVKIPYYTTEKYINKTKSFTDLGAGWEFDFPYIEIRDETEYYDDDMVSVPYEYLHYGTRGTWKYDYGETYSNLSGYLLKDMKLTSSGGKFDSRAISFILTEADGKKSYFGSKGELIGIEDRFGNKIRFYYNSNSTTNNAYLLTKIIDTVGREVNFDYSRSGSVSAYDPLTQAFTTTTRKFVDITINDPNTSTTKTISYAKDKILGVGLTRVDSDGEESVYDITDLLDMYKLSQTTDSEGLTTKYGYGNTYTMLSMTDKNLELGGTEIPYCNLNTITYPTGASTSFQGGTITDNFGTDGIRKYQAYTSAYMRNVYYDVDANKIKGDKVITERIDHNVSVSDGVSTAHDYKTASGYPHFRNVKEIPFEPCYVVSVLSKNVDVDDSDDAIQTTNSYIYKNDAYLLSDSTVEATTKQTVNEITSEPAFVRETTSYTYNNKNLCTKKETKSFSDPGESTHNDYVSNTIQRTYDDWGNILTETPNSDNNRKITYEYDSEYHYPTRKEYKSESGTTIVEKYTPSNNHKTIQETTVLENNSTKKKSTYEYDTHGNVTKINQYGVGGDMSQYATKTFAYSDSNNVISNAYVTMAKVSDLKNVDGTSISAVQQNFVYDYYGNVIRETDCNGNVYNYEYDSKNRLTKVTNPDGSYRTYTYNIEFVNTTTNKVAKNQVTETDENGTVICRDYNSVGNLVSEYNVTDNKQLSKYTYAFDKGQDIVETYSDVNNGSKQVTEYDALGRKTYSEVLDSAGNSSNKQTYAYEVLPATQQFKITTTVIGDTDDENVDKIQYTDKYGNVVKEETVYKDNGVTKTAVTTYTHDYLGNVKTVREPRATDENWSANQYTAKYDYDVDGNVTKETDINGYTIVNTYDGLGNLTSVKDKNGNITLNTYDNLGRLLKEQIPFQKNGSATVYATNKYYYDGNGNVTKSQTANNAVGSSDSYTKTEYQYNWQNQPVKVKGYDGNDVESCVQYYYDSVGNVLRMYTGDVNNLVINGLDNVSGATDYAVTKYAYDSMNRCISQTDAMGQVTSNTYDINGNLISTTDRNGNILSYAYDGLNNLISKSSNKTADDTYTYAYNKKGLRTSMTGGGVDTTSIYNGLGQLSKETLTDGTVKEYNYDMNGNRKSFKLTKDNTVQYTLTYDYDKMNQLTKVYEDGDVKAEYTYNPDGTLKKSTYGNQTANYSYNLANLLTEVNNANSGTQISKYNYTYYVDGNQKSKSESVAGTDKGTTNYTYDGVNRLVTEQAPDKTLNYQYDSYGNRSQLSVTGDEAYTTSYTYDKNNRLRKQTKAAGSASEITDFWYDPNGNQISSMTITTGGTGTAGIGIQPAGQSTNSYSEYNSWNQLISTMQNGKTASYAYNGDGLRMSKTVDGVKTSHIWDGTNIAGDVTNGTVTKYIRGLQLISSKTGSNESFYTYNGHGDVVQLTGGNGSITKQYSYDAFGVEKDKAENDTNPFRYCGEYYDTETDSVYLRARYYAPVTGRFITEDSYWDVDNMIYSEDDSIPSIENIMQSSNIYIYTMSNPIMWIDVLGLFSQNSLLYQGGNNSYTDVKTLQNKLNTMGYNAGSVDGIFGPKTKDAVERFQRNAGLTVDGIVGKNTWNALGLSYTQTNNTTQNNTVIWREKTFKRDQGSYMLTFTVKYKTDGNGRLIGYYDSVRVRTSTALPNTTFDVIAVDNPITYSTYLKIYVQVEYTSYMANIPYTGIGISLASNIMYVEVNETTK